MAMTTEEIVSSLFKRIGDNYSTTDIDWPGIEFDTEESQEWIAPAILGITADPQRTDQGRKNIQFQIGLFVKKAGNVYRQQEVEDAVRAVLDQKSFQVKDYDQGSPPQTGVMHIPEGQTANMGTDLLRAELRHQVITWNAWADKL